MRGDFVFEPSSFRSIYWEVICHPVADYISEILVFWKVWIYLAIDFVYISFGLSKRKIFQVAQYIPNVIYGLIKIWPATNKQRIETQTCLRLQSQIDNECIMITRLYRIDKQNFIFSLSNKNRYHHEAR